MSKYIFYETPNNTVVCVSRYKGQLIKAKAKCSPLDTYDRATGEMIAQARVDAKIAKKKHMAAVNRYSTINREYNKIAAELQKAALKAARLDSERQYAEYHAAMVGKEK